MATPPILITVRSPKAADGFHHRILNSVSAFRVAHEPANASYAGASSDPEHNEQPPSTSPSRTSTEDNASVTGWYYFRRSFKKNSM
ncbi:unnamed protein product [Gongylonema pulchrum]|uniref:Uncharacterized protein n=1 Tax=Gongylonema pulchrum TaxID=637853 RepID=A0A183DE97_9BILA|nr:unnamed protein product [Gongylonema pulchrum]